MFPLEIDLAKTLHDDKARDIARHNQTHRVARDRGMDHRARRAVGSAMVAIGSRLVPAVPEPPPRPLSVSQ